MKQTRITLPFSLVVALVLGTSAAPGSAQTLDELRAQIQDMTKRLQELEAKQEQMEENTDVTRPDSRAVISGKKGAKLTVSDRHGGANRRRHRRLPD
jgi:outer membrane murein-binding lipoprotein Lpp